MSILLVPEFSGHELKVAIAAGFHLFPFRTEKLSPPAPMVLQFLWESRSLPTF